MGRPAEALHSFVKNSVEYVEAQAIHIGCVRKLFSCGSANGARPAKGKSSKNVLHL